MENIFYPLLGGVLIGVSTSMMMGGLGRITGISGILRSTLQKPQKDLFWRYKFLAGLIIGGALTKIAAPGFFEYEFSEPLIKVLIAGLLVGFGTSLGSGCTSGHGVCGLARVSKRSMIATITFILFGMITVTLTRLLS